MSETPRIAAVVTTAEPQSTVEMALECAKAARAAASVRVFFRDESIPGICAPAVARRLLGGAGGGKPLPSDQKLHRALRELAASGDVRLYACSSSLYVWGVSAQDLLPDITARGLIAFLADDLAGATRVLCS